MNAPGQGVGANAFDEGGWRGGDQPKKEKKSKERSKQELAIDLIAKQKHVKELEALLRDLHERYGSTECPLFPQNVDGKLLVCHSAYG